MGLPFLSTTRLMQLVSLLPFSFMIDSSFLFRSKEELTFYVKGIYFGDYIYVDWSYDLYFG